MIDRRGAPTRRFGRNTLVRLRTPCAERDLKTSHRLLSSGVEAGAVAARAEHVAQERRDLSMVDM
jgi:hypothetical protein